MQGHVVIVLTSFNIIFEGNVCSFYDSMFMAGKRNQAITQIGCQQVMQR